MSDQDIWSRLKSFTQARIGLERAGRAPATREWLQFQLAHARAREAVHHPWDYERLAAELGRMGVPVLKAQTLVPDRATYLRRPDLGRKLATPLARAAEESELAVIVSDGLSARAVETHFLPLWRALEPRLRAFTRAPLVLAPYGRVALSDEIGVSLNVKIGVMMIGERPGLSASDSLGIYLTYDPRPGKHDALRNCISNIRPPEGLSYDIAAISLVSLIEESLRRKLSGVALTDLSNRLA